MPVVATRRRDDPSEHPPQRERTPTAATNQSDTLPRTAAFAQQVQESSWEIAALPMRVIRNQKCKMINPDEAITSQVTLDSV